MREETNLLARKYERDWYNNLVSKEHAEELDEIHSELNYAQELHSYNPNLYENVNIDEMWHEVGNERENDARRAAEEAEEAEGGDEMKEAKFDEDYD